MFEDLKLNILMAYPYLKPGMLEFLKNNQSDIRFLLDSGAFTAWRTGKLITLDDYCRFLDALPFKPWRYFMLDVVGNPDATLANYQTMLSRGFKPIPIFTRGEDPAILDEYYKTSDVVGIGGLVGTHKNKGFVKAIMKRVNGRRVHWLGFCHPDFLIALKPYMADSTTWSNGHRYGAVPLYLGGGIFKQVRKEVFFKRSQKNTQAEAVQRMGFDPDDLRSGEKFKKVVLRIGMASWIRLGFDLYEKNGTNLFLAGLSEQNLAESLEEFHRQRTIRGKINGTKKSNRNFIGRNGFDDGSRVGEVEVSR